MGNPENNPTAITTQRNSDYEVTVTKVAVGNQLRLASSDEPRSGASASEALLILLSVANKEVGVTDRVGADLYAGLRSSLVFALI